MYVAAGNLKEYGIAHWMAPNFAFPNLGGFDALPGGTRTGITFDLLGQMGGWWSSTVINSTSAKYLRMHYNEESTYGSFGRGDSFGWNDKHNGYSVRCVKDL
jgi:uncharacterized protein (TIGR02145 family)